MSETPPDRHDAALPGPHEVPEWLFGMWRLLRAEAELDFAPGVRMEFLPGGRLRYHIDVGGHDQVIALVYAVDGDMMRTDNPAAPREKRVLVFDFSGARAWFVRESA